MPDLRLEQLIVENFRSISGRCVIPLDGAITLVHGANGAGKTSLLSAIELGATGRVSFLEEQGKDTRSLLRHQDFPLGSVHLSLTDKRNGPRIGSYKLAGEQVTGKAALSPEEQTYFLERSFLPQTALGRLLESYTDTGKQVDNALVRFVKSLVGLDDLDALINGLHASGDRRRSKKVIHAWSRSADDLDALLQRQKEVSAQLRSSKTQFNVDLTLLRNLVGDPHITNVNELVHVSDERARAAESSRPERARLAELQAAIDAITNMRQQFAASRPGEIDELETLRAKEAEEAKIAYATWQSEAGHAALTTLNRIRATVADWPAVAIDHLADAFTETREYVAHVDQQHAAAIAADQERSELIETLDQKIQDIDQKILNVEARRQAIEVPADVRVLLEILELTIPITHSECCPICDEEYTGTGSLVEHFSAKLERLSVHSSHLLATHRELKVLQEDRLAKVRQVVLQKSLPWLPAGKSMDETLRTLNEIEPSVAEGIYLRRRFQSTQASMAEVSAQVAEKAIVTNRIAEVRRALNLSARDLPAHEPEVKLGREIAERVQAIRDGEIQRLREREAREAIEVTQRDVVRWEHELREVEREIIALQKQVSLAEARMASSRQVMQAAERTRSRLINEVFDQSLNSLWAQLFGRFAPSERFTPRFVKQTESSRSVDVSLETELPGGRISGSPGAMLSYGNTNSAALALFMALNLSAPSELDWLIFDDPVQSMDDIHIANFAAIVRQLAYVHQRQVVIAIHQPELFDYLSLALAPSDATQSLVRVRLDRGTGTTMAHVDRVEYLEEPLLHRAN